MRTNSLLPLFTAALLTGCGPEAPRPPEQETALRNVASVTLPDRDLTLQPAAAPAVEVASPAELSRPAPEPRRSRQPRVLSKPAPRPDRKRAAEVSPGPEPAPVPSPLEAVAEAVVAEAIVAEAPAEDAAEGAGRELAPGRTVTVIPASSGPSLTPEEPSWDRGEGGRGIMVGGGGRCRPRGGRGIGIAARIPNGVPGLRLR